LRAKPKLKKTTFDFDFSELTIKGRGVQGNILTKHTVRNIVQREEGISTLGARDIWYDETVRRLNTDERGEHLGAFKGDDKILTVLSSGEFKLSGFDLSTHFDDNMLQITKLNPDNIFTAVYFDGDIQKYYVKRFQISDETINKKYLFISSCKGSKLEAFSLDYLPQLEVEIKSKNSNEIEFEVIPIADFIGLKTYRAKGKRLSNKELKKLRFIDPLPDEAEAEAEVEIEVEKVDEAKVREETKRNKKPNLEKLDNQPPNDEDEIQMELEF
ncbi:MAG: DNA gyrase/topoisomerase IV subunit A, partial [Bacteroidetes bacterium]